MALAEQTMAHTFDTKVNKLMETTFRRKGLVATGKVHFKIRAPSVLWQTCLPREICRIGGLKYLPGMFPILLSFLS